VTVAFLVAGAALDKGREVAMFLTKDAVRLALPGHASGFVPNARLAGATPMWEWLGDGAHTVFSY
jgi:hypothetical protein